MNTNTRISIALAAALFAAGCHRNANDAGSDMTVPAPGSTAAMPADTTLPADATAPAPVTTMATPADTTGASSATDVAADQRFLADAMRGNEEEIAVTALAMDKGGVHVKPLATMLNKDHVAMRDKLDAVAHGTPPAATANAPAELAALDGKDFDTRVLSMLLDAHERTISKFTEAGTNVALSEDVRMLATQSLPTLKAHLEAVKAAQAKE